MVEERREGKAPQPPFHYSCEYLSPSLLLFCLIQQRFSRVVGQRRGESLKILEASGKRSIRPKITHEEATPVRNFSNLQMNMRLREGS